jgi:hypothetical protein
MGPLDERLKEFELIVTSKEVWKYLTSTLSLSQFLDEGIGLVTLQESLGLTLEDLFGFHEKLVQRGLISESWIEFKSWYKESRGDDYLYRGLRKVSDKSYELLREKGNDRECSNGKTQTVLEAMHNIGSHEYIWAGDLDIAWRKHTKGRRRLIAVYD